MDTILYSIVLLAVAALFGVYMLLRVLAGAAPPWTAAILHGLLAASGLVLLLYEAFLRADADHPQTVAIAAVLLVIAALGGLFLVSQHARGKVPSKPLALIHALAAVAGFGTLAFAQFAV